MHRQSVYVLPCDTLLKTLRVMTGRWSHVSDAAVQAARQEAAAAIAAACQAQLLQQADAAEEELALAWMTGREVALMNLERQRTCLSTSNSATSRPVTQMPEYANACANLAALQVFFCASAMHAPCLT